MSVYRRALIYAALALAAPLPALALTGEDDPAPEPAQERLAVSASLDSCGTAADMIVCKIDATWNDVAGATRYTASVTRADDSVVDFGTVGAGAASFWVPYAGNGTYTVTVSAYGEAPGEEKAEVVARDTSSAGPGGEPGKGAAQAAPGAAADVDSETAERPDSAPEDAEPDCEEAPANDGERLSGEAGSALDESAALPRSVECPSDAEAAAPASG